LSAISLLVKSTLSLYKRCFMQAFRVSLRSWKLFFIQIAGLVILGLVSLILPKGFVSSLILGLILAYFLSCYLCLVRYGLDGEKFDFESLMYDANALFSFVISALFTFFLLNFIFEIISGMKIAAINTNFLKSAFGILVAVFLNPLPEVIYIRGGSVAETFQVSFEFVKENFIEWFLPVIVFILLVSSFYRPSPEVLFQIMSINPLHQVELILYELSSMALSPYMVSALFLILLVLYFVMIFRGSLYKELQFGRRQRLYKEKMNS